jgi:hypothetical protein
MTKTVTTLAVALLFAGPAQGVRIWFSLSGAPENQPIAGTPGEYFLEYNPVINAGPGGMSRLYVWGMHEATMEYRAAGLDVNVYAHFGDVSIVDSHFYNYIGKVMPESRRWDLVNQGTITPTRLDDVWMQSILAYSWGLGYRAELFGDLQYDPQTRSMLLGYVDLEMTPGAQGEVFFGTGYGGFASQPPIFEAFYGWGDPPVPLYPPGQQSTLPDAYIVPEPATLWLCALAGLTALRRRHRSPRVTRSRFTLG